MVVWEEYSDTVWSSTVEVKEDKAQVEENVARDVKDYKSGFRRQNDD